MAGLHACEDALDARSDGRDGLVEPNLPVFQRLAASGLVHDAVLYAFPGKKGPMLLAGIGLIRVNGLLIARDKLLERHAVVHIRAGESRGPDQVRAFIHADVALVTVSADAVFLGPARLRVHIGKRAAAAFGRFGWPTFVRNQEADYLLAVNANQPSLLSEMGRFFDKANTDFPNSPRSR